MERISPELSVGDAQKVDSTFVDYKRFEGNAEDRAEARDRFFRGETWAPEYEYPRLEQLYDAKTDDDIDRESGEQIFLMDRKAEIQRYLPAGAGPREW